MGNLNYGDYSEDTALEEKEEIDASGAAFMKLKVGRNIVRILPPPAGKRSPFRTAFQHFIEMAGVRKSVICARQEARKPCLVCQKIDEMRKSRLPVDQEMANAMFARRRIFCNVIDRSDEAKGPKVLAFGKTVHEQLVALRTDPSAGGDYVHPEEGCDVIITRSGTGKNDTKYQVALARKESPLERSGDTNVMQAWIDAQQNLEQYAKLPSGEEVKQLLSGEAEDETPAEEGEEEEEAAPRRPAPKPAGNRPAPRPTVTTAPRVTVPKKTAAAAPKRRSVEDDVIDVEGEEVES